VVSNRKGGEDSDKLATYAWISIPYYVIFDPEQQLSEQVLRVYELRGGSYAPLDAGWLPNVGLGLTLWSGVYADAEETWLRWCYQDGTLIPTGAEQRIAREQAEQQASEERTARQQAEQRASDAEQQASEERTAREQAEERAARLVARLRELGIDPEER